jgi:hypothetical protein
MTDIDGSHSENDSCLPSHDDERKRKQYSAAFSYAGQFGVAEPKKRSTTLRASLHDPQQEFSDDNLLASTPSLDVDVSLSFAPDAHAKSGRVG